MPVIEKIKPIISPQIVADTQQILQPESQVVVHFSFTASYETLIRIWQSTFIFSKQCTHQSKLLFAENITMQPTWTLVETNDTHHFTLLFEGLPSSCKTFDLQEVIPEPNGFVFKNIVRNDTDVYHLKFS
jgi:hypothetical protein